MKTSQISFVNDNPKKTKQYDIYLKKEQAGEPCLKYIFISPSQQCNAQCVHCYEKFEGNDIPYLSTEIIKDIIDQFEKLGGQKVYFCSGEFLMRTDALELIRYVSAKGILVSITTNGILIDTTMITKLKDAGLTRLIVSLDSYLPEEHDKLRGVNGMFDKAINAINLAMEVGIKTQIWTYVSKSNMNNLDGIAEISKKLASMPAFVFFPLLSGNMFNKFEDNLNLEDREYFRSKYNDNPNINLEFPSEDEACRGGGKDHINIAPTGGATFCPAIPYAYGNIKEKSLSDILLLIKEDYIKFCNNGMTGQCPVNFMEYRNKCNAKFIH